jgi:PAS domain S-box-containing protein
MTERSREHVTADEEGSGPLAAPNRKHLLPLIDGQADSSAALFGRLLETSPDPVIVVDRAGRILFANLEAERVFEYPPNTLIGENVDLLVPERLRATHAIHRGRYAESPRVRPMGSNLTLFGRKRGGAEFPVEISLSPVTVGEQTLFSANIRDITERRRNEIELRRTQGQLLSAVESIQGAFALFDTHDRFVLCNSTYREIVGGRLTGDLVGRAFRDVIEASVASGTFATDELGAEDLIRRWTAYHTSPSGALDVRAQSGQHLRIVERRTAEGGVVATIWDVTDEVTYEDELRQARAVAEAASAAKSEFLASMSHELRTPLNAVLGFAQLLQRDKRNPLSPRQHERVEHVLRGGEHLLRLIDDVLDLARIEAGRVLISLEPVRIADVLAEVNDTLAAMAERAQVHLSVDPFEPSELEVIADRTRFKQILMNYGSNAIKYNRPNGSARLRLDANEDVARISVVDDGVGIADAKQVSLFQPFQRAGQEAGAIEGTGIGLVITKRLAELMKGSVGFESVEGRGSRFWVELPVHRTARASVAPSAPACSSQDSALGGNAGPRYLVVYVEDNPSNIAFMEDLLADFERVQLLTAPTAEIGIELVRGRRPDVVIMDINLPGMSGFEATQKLAAWPETRDIPVIALSAAAMIRDAVRVAGAGFYRYLTKPVKVDELTATLEELLTRSDKPS